MQWRARDNDPTAMYTVHNVDGSFVYVGDGATLMGWDPEELKAKENPYKFLRADDLEAVATGHDAMLQLGEEITFVYRYPRPDQSEIWVETRARREDIGGKTFTTATTRPTSARKAAYVKRAI